MLCCPCPLAHRRRMASAEALCPGGGLPAHPLASATACLLTPADIVPRLSAEMFAAFLNELAGFDWRPVAKERDLPLALSVVQHLQQLFRGRGEAGAAASRTPEKGEAAAVAAKERQAKGEGGNGESQALLEDEAGPGSPTTAALDSAAAAVRVTAADRAVQERQEAGEGQGAGEAACPKGVGTAAYDPFVPGRVVFIYRLPAEEGGSECSGDDSEGGSAADAVAEARRTAKVLLPPWHPALRSIRLTQHLLRDHFLDSPFALALYAPPGAEAEAVGAGRLALAAGPS